MQLLFEKIRYKNFMSVGENAIELNLTKSPSTLICGKNAAGKSIVLEVLTFVLFGKSYRGINKPSLVNSTNQKDCLVEIWFSKGKDSYHVTRGISPNIFVINKNGKDLDVDSAVRDQQSYFETSVLGADFKTFSQLVIIGAASYTPFMKLTAQQRRDMVESILDIGVFSNMNKVLKGKISSWKQDYRDTESKIERVESEIKLLEDFIKKSEVSIQNTVSKKQKELRSILSDAKSVKDKITAISVEDTKTYENEIKALRNDRETLLKSTSIIEHDLKTLSKKMSFFENNNVCPSCEQEISENHKEQTLEDLKNEEDNSKEKLEKERSEVSLLDSKIKTVADKVKEESEKERLLSSLKNKMDSLKQRAVDLKKDINKLSNSSNTDTTEQKDKIKERRGQLSLLKENIKTLNEKKKLYTRAQKLLKDDGIKSLIIRKYVPILNSYVNKYLRILNFNITFELDENFNENLKTRYKNEFRYSNFSMGERQRLDLALMFAWLNVARSKNSLSTNLLILDEVEGHLDKSGSDDILEIIDTLGENMNIFVISHKETMEDRIRSIVRFEKIKGFTKIAS